MTLDGGVDDDRTTTWMSERWRKQSNPDDALVEWNARTSDDGILTTATDESNNISMLPLPWNKSEWKTKRVWVYTKLSETIVPIPPPKK